jgi:hypothetical protein
VSNVETHSEAVRKDVASLIDSAAIVTQEASLTRKNLRHDLASLREKLAARDEKMSALMSSVLSQTHPTIASARTDHFSPAHRLAKSIVTNLAFCAELFGFLHKEMSSARIGMGVDDRQGLSTKSFTPGAIAAAADANQPLAMLAIAIAAAASLDVRMGLAMASCYALFRAVSSQQRLIAARMTHSRSNMVVLIDLLGRERFIDPAMIRSVQRIGKES